MNLNTFDIIEAAYRSRLLFRTEEEYRQITGVAYETIRDCKEDTDALAAYYEKLDKECLRQCGMPLHTIMKYYMEASDICLDGKSADSKGAAAGFDWMERDQLASRKKFCRWMFRKVSAPGRKMGIEEESRFKPKKSDPKLFDQFYPDGFEEGRLYDLIFVMLITFGVIRPYTSDSKRGRDITDSEAKRSCETFRNLVETLRDDTPQIGVLPKPMIFDITLKKLQEVEAHGLSHYSVAEIWDMLDNIENACLATASPQRASDAEVTMAGYSMPGIWVDDSDEGRSRFWIFPENKLMAFCYRSNGAGWQLVPYEFVFFCSNNGDDFSESCTFATAKGNDDIIGKSDAMTEASEIVSTSYVTDCIAENDELFDKISFTIQSGNTPEWMDWHSFRRLDAADPLHARYMKVVKDIYDPESTQSLLFENVGALLTDAMNSLIAVDNEYLYVSDMPRPERFILICDKAKGYRFTYEPVFGKQPEVTGLRNAIVSEEHPLYLLPRDFPEPENQTDKKHIKERERLFKEACRNMDFGDQISIYRSPRYKRGNLCFNRFSLLFSLDEEEIEKYGALRITKPAELFPQPEQD